MDVLHNLGFFAPGTLWRWWGIPALWQLSLYMCWMNRHNTYSSKACKVICVCSQNMRNVVYTHRRDESCIMNLHSSNAKLDHERTPFLIDRCLLRQYGK